MSEHGGGARVPLRTVAREWGRIGCLGFGGPPAHISLLRRLCVDQRAWLSAAEFEDGVAAVNLLPGPASTQLCIYAAWRLRGLVGALVGGFFFIVPGLVVILLLSAVFLVSHPPLVVAGVAAGAGAAVPAVAVQASRGLIGASWTRAGHSTAGRARWALYLLAGGVAGATIGPWLALVLLACGLLEMGAAARPTSVGGWLPLAVVSGTAAGGLGAVAWVAFKVGALSYGGGFVIIPLMQHDAVHTYHWMTSAQFLTAVALGQITPGPVVQTVAVVGYAAGGVGYGLMASLCAFSPSVLFVTAGANRFGRMRGDRRMQSFLTGAGAAAIGAIAGSAVPLASALAHLWQVGVLALAAVWLVVVNRSVVAGIVGAALLGMIAVLAGAAP